jgi:TonB family protein
MRMAALAGALLAMLGGPAMAQDAQPPARLSERVLREADSPFRWIKIHSESVRKTDDARRAAASATATKPVAVAKPVPVRSAAAAPASAVLLASAAPAARSEPADSRDADDGAVLVTVDRAEPEWDDELLRRLRKGRVVVRFHVAQDGYLSRIEIVESTSPRLTGPAMAAVMQWRFEPIAEPRVATAEFGFDVDSTR